jgi:hypothetical protein
VRIPANSVTVLNGTGPNLPRLYDVIVEPSQTTGQLPASYIVVHTFVTVRNGHFSFRVANIAEKLKKILITIQTERFKTQARVENMVCSITQLVNTLLGCNFQRKICGCSNEFFCLYITMQMLELKNRFLVALLITKARAVLNQNII